MKLLFASDIHGNADAAAQLAARVDEFRPDRIVLLGDLLYHGPRNPLPAGYDTLATAATLNDLAARYPLTAVRGNCDAEVDQMVLAFPITAPWQTLPLAAAPSLEDAPYLLATHGHLELPADVASSAAAIVSGHTHVKVLDRAAATAATAADAAAPILLNPGSAGLPKDGEAGYATFADGTFRLHRLSDGAVLSALSLTLTL